MTNINHTKLDDFKNRYENILLHEALKFVEIPREMLRKKREIFSEILKGPREDCT
ncbi:MAG: hypothetical protein OIN88_04100 [Candidatus Methanoperedens sp.]|nr:hypothetical protein [Candidatus Methanoperedens sp.]